jgi:hypothetical protein
MEMEIQIFDNFVFTILIRLFYFINNFEDMLGESERYLLNTYHRKLDEENKAKYASNKLLR